MCILNCNVYTDYLVSICKSVLVNILVQSYDDENDFIYVDTRPTISVAGLKLVLFCDTFDMPNKLIYGGTSEQIVLKNSRV